MARIEDSEDVDFWLSGKPRELVALFAARAALRAVPTLATTLAVRGKEFSKTEREIVLPVFRAVAASWTMAQYSPPRIDIRAVAATAYAAGNAANKIGLAFGGTVAAEAAAFSARQAVRTVSYSTSNDLRVERARDAVAAAADALDIIIDDKKRDSEGYIALSNDATAMEALLVDGKISSASLTRVARLPLWPLGVPDVVRKSWARLEKALLSQQADWQVWTNWYRARLAGRRCNAALEIARASIPNEIWNRGPELVNGEIARLISEHSSSSPKRFQEDSGPSIETVPAQGPGPRFRTTDEGPVDRAPPVDVDAYGNDVRTIDGLRPLALQCAADLKARLPPNQFGELLSAVELYVMALDPGGDKSIEWGEVWGHGVILQNAASAADRRIEDRLLPALEDPAKTALESLLAVHGPMILATYDGARLSEAASNFRLTREQQDDLRAPALKLAEQLKKDAEVATARAVTSVVQATGSMGQGPHPERGSVYGLATVKNISIVLVGGAAIATPAIIGAFLGSVVVGAAAGAPLSLVAVEAVKKSAAFNALVTQLGAKLDSISDDELRAWLEERSRRFAPFRKFVARNAEPLRKIAETTPELKWMLRYIDFISADKP